MTELLLSPPQKPKWHSVRAGVITVLIALTVGAAVVMPFYFSRDEKSAGSNRMMRLIQTHDLPTLLAIMDQFDKGLRSGVLYPRWYPDWNNGYGIPMGNFYPPGLFYLTTLINAATKDWVHTLFIICVLSLAGSGLALYHLARQFFGRPASAAAALVYMLFPVHQLDLYWRGAIPQFFGYVMLPLVFYFVYRLGSRGRARDYAAVGLLHGVYIMTHLPVSYMFTYALAFFAVLWAVRARDWKILLRLAGGLAIAILVSAIFWLPAAIERRDVYEWVSATFPYHHVYLTLLPAKNPFDKLINNAFTFNALALIVVIVVLRQAASRQPSELAKENSRHSAWLHIRLWMIMGVATIFMTTSFSICISMLIPEIQIAVPPFRWLAITSMFTALLIGACVEHWRSLAELRPAVTWACRAALIAVVAMNLWLTAQGVIIQAVANPSFEPTAKFSESGSLPKGATWPHLLPDGELALLEPQGGTIEMMNWEPTYRKVSVKVDDPATLRLKTYNFPGWTARVNGKVVPLLSDKDGIQVVELAPGVNVVEVSFENTWPRTVGTAVSAIAFLFVIGLTLAPGLRHREAAGARREQAATKRMPRIALIVGAAAIGVVLLAVILSRSGAQDASRSDSPAAAPASQGTAGSDPRLSLRGAEAIRVAADPAALNELVGALSARDTQKVEALVQAGKVFTVENNTRVRVL
ncbi:MAG TPA: 6-pyruvoyl-tetrahydropterin synthase-related protein, partial [Blastocatellia bacterium]|nr:6-pyruvoyl-tetrahydropterin synthase-related protein [Blastocatellia bacterium]